MPVDPDLWSAIQKLTLGGKIPFEDEAHYFLDSNYQLQNMLVLSQPERKVSPASDPKHYFQPYTGPVNYLPFQKMPLPSPYSDVSTRPFKEEENPPVHMPPEPEQTHYGGYSHQLPYQYYNGPGLLNPTAGEPFHLPNPPGPGPGPGPYQNGQFQYVPVREYQEDVWKETL